MTLVTPLSSRERILLYGAAGVGKTRQWMAMTEHLDGRFLVVDTDNALLRMTEAGDYDEDRFVFTDVHDFAAAIQTFEKYAMKAKADDWVVIDLLSPIWPWTMDYWQQRVTGMSKTDLMFRPRSDVSTKDWNWPEINSWYATVFEIFLTSRCHLLAVCEEDDLNTEQSNKWRDKEDIANTFRDVGKKPRGNKRNAHVFHTVLHLTKTGAGRTARYLMTTVKDREREGDRALNSTEVNNKNLATAYLEPVAGWYEEHKEEEETASEEEEEISTDATRRQGRSTVTRRRKKQ